MGKAVEMFDNDAERAAEFFYSQEPEPAELETASTEKPESSKHKKRKKKLCVICMDKEAAYAVVPCGHQCLCQTCSQQTLCPICRGPLESTLKIFVAGIEQRQIMMLFERRYK